MRRGAPNPTWRSVYRPPRRVRCATSDLGAPRRLFRCATSDRGEPSERVGAPCRPAARRQKGAPGCSTLPLLGCGSGSGRWRHTRREPSSSADRAMRATTAPGVTRPSTGDATVHRCEAAVTGASDRGHGLAAWHVLVRRSSGMAWLSVWPQGLSFWPAARRGGSGLSFWPSRFSVWPQGLSSWSAASRGDAYPANGCVPSGHLKLLRCPFGHARCPFGQARRPFSRARCPFGQARCPFGQDQHSDARSGLGRSAASAGSAVRRPRRSARTPPTRPSSVG